MSTALRPSLAWISCRMPSDQGSAPKMPTRNACGRTPLSSITSAMRRA
jgi:hypothetical protein